MTTFNRRDILRAGGVGAFFSAFANASSPARLLRSFAPSGMVPDTTPRLLTIFLRGAHDGVHTVVPVGDPTYTTARANLQPGTVALPGTTFARLNSAYQSLAAITANRAAFVHQVGNPTGGRSHFVEMQVYEGAQNAAPLREDGVIARLRAAGALGSGPLGRVYGASISQRMQQLYRGFSSNELLAHVRALNDYTLGSSPIVDRQRASMATHLSQSPGGPIEPFIDAVGEYVAATEMPINGVTYTHDGMAFPTNGTESTAAGFAYPNFPLGHGFMGQCEQAVQLMKASVGCQAVGIEFGAWDTHNNQMSERAPLDEYLAYGINSLYQALEAALMTNYVILVMTEFGRTNIENGTIATAGTDHGVGGLMMAFGPRVNGGVYNCHNGSGLGRPWRNLGTSPTTYTTFPNACPVSTDFRRIYAELFFKLFGIPHGPGSTMETVIPGWQDTNYLGCFN